MMWQNCRQIKKHIFIRLIFKHQYSQIILRWVEHGWRIKKNQFETIKLTASVDICRRPWLIKSTLPPPGCPTNPFTVTFVCAKTISNPHPGQLSTERCVSIYVCKNLKKRQTNAPNIKPNQTLARSETILNMHDLVGSKHNDTIYAVAHRIASFAHSLRVVSVLSPHIVTVVACGKIWIALC